MKCWSPRYLMLLIHRDVRSPSMFSTSPNSGPTTDFPLLKFPSALSYNYHLCRNRICCFASICCQSNTLCALSGRLSPIWPPTKAIDRAPKLASTQADTYHDKFPRALCSGLLHSSTMSTMSTRPQWYRGMMYNNANQSDVVIRVGNQTIHAHKSVLMARSGLFYTAFSSNFSVAGAATYDIEGHGPDVVECMIRYIYDAPLDEVFKLCSSSDQDRSLRLFMLLNEYQVPGMGKIIAMYLVNTCDTHVKGLVTDAKHLTDLRRVLGQVAMLYQDNVIADRSLIDYIANFLRAEPCRILTISVPEVLEILFVQRTTCPSYKPSSATTCTFFPPVTMADYSVHDLTGNRHAPANRHSVLLSSFSKSSLRSKKGSISKRR